MLTGKTLGRYEIREKIGAGGMGEVYLAHDTQLDRRVALKVLLAEFCSDEERVQRFKLEAKAASALNHPNIITIHEVGESDGQLYIATEFVDGETLRDKMSAGSLGIADCVKIAEQVADAISAAHEAHIVHRDIKPENIMIRRDGYAKILDFGLAKPTPNHNTTGDDAATMQMVQTQAGLVMGSVRYMSPEQARGKKTDERTDVWSLGVVLYEMVTGRNPFEGETVSDSLAALIHVEPEPVSQFVEGVPEELETIIRKALSKSVDDRYQTARKMADELKHVHYLLEHADLAENRTISVSAVSNTESVNKIRTGENPTLIHRTLSAEVEEKRRSGGNEAVTSGPVAPRRFSYKFAPVIAFVLAAVVGLNAWWFWPKISGKSRTYFEDVQVSRLTEEGRSFWPEISPDGKYVAFVNQEGGYNSLLVRQVETNSGVQLVPKTTARIPQPTFSNDGTYVYYTTVENGVGTVYRIPTLGVSVGGEAKKIIADVDSKISFSPDSARFVFARHNPSEGGDKVVIANSDGTNETPFLDTKEIGYDAIREVSWSPDGESILVGAFKRAGDGQQRVKLLLVSVKDKTSRVIGDKAWIGAMSFNWLKDGSGIMFVGKDEVENSSRIWHMSLPDGRPRQVTNDLSDYFSLSLADDDRTMATSKVDSISTFWSFDPATKETKQISPENRNNAGFAGIEAGPNNKLYYTKRAGKSVNIMEANADGSAEKQLIADGSFNLQPAVSHDQKYLVFTSNRSGHSRIWRTDLNGGNPVRLSDEDNNEDFNPQITADNKTVVFLRATKDGGRSALMSVPIEGGETKPLLPEGSPIQVHSRLSPDGKKIAYCSVTFKENPVTLEAKMIISAFDGTTVGKTEKEMPITWNDVFDWSPDNRALIYASPDGNSNVWEYPLETGKARQLTEMTSGKIAGFSWSADGKKLFIVRAVVNSDLILIKETQG